MQKHAALDALPGALFAFVAHASQVSPPLDVYRPAGHVPAVHALCAVWPSAVVVPLKGQAVHDAPEPKLFCGQRQSAACALEIVKLPAALPVYPAVDAPATLPELKAAEAHCAHSVAALDVGKP